MNHAVNNSLLQQKIQYSVIIKNYLNHAIFSTTAKKIKLDAYGGIMSSN